MESTTAIAAAKVVPFGKYAGRTIGSIAQLPDGEEHLMGLLDNRFLSHIVKQSIKDFYRETKQPTKKQASA